MFRHLHAGVIAEFIWKPAVDINHAAYSLEMMRSLSTGCLPIPPAHRLVCHLTDCDSV
jgi:hypothetical protein